MLERFNFDTSAYEPDELKELIRYNESFDKGDYEEFLENFCHEGVTFENDSGFFRILICSTDITSEYQYDYSKSLDEQLTPKIKYELFKALAKKVIDEKVNTFGWLGC